MEKFVNCRSVKFNLDSFALPINKTVPKKNTIYSAVLSNLVGAKDKLSPKPAVNNYGYDITAKWRNWTFAANSNGIFAANDTLSFQTVSNYIFPIKLLAANDRMFAIDANGKCAFHTVDLTKTWTASGAIGGSVYIPDGYGKCVDLALYHNNLLLVCENGLLKVEKNLNVKHLTDDSGVPAANLTNSEERVWGSGWFSLGYATDTQVLREVFLKTDILIELSAVSNHAVKTVTVPPSEKVQKIKTNLRGDQFKIRIIVPAGDFAISNLSAVVSYGKA
jgi:hypothetical protein